MRKKGSFKLRLILPILLFFVGNMISNIFASDFNKYCGCNPETSTIIPNTAIGIHNATEKCTDGFYTHYCDNHGRLLLSIDAISALAIAPTDVEINIHPITNYYQQLCKGTGGTQDGSCFITNNDGAIILPRTWDVNSSATDAAIRYYFDQTDIDLVNNGLANAGLDGFNDPNQMWFYKVINGNGHEKPQDLNASEVEIIDFNGSNTPSTNNYVLGNTVNGWYAEYLVDSFSGGGGGGAQNGSSPTCPAIEAVISGNGTIPFPGGYLPMTIDITGGVGPYELLFSTGVTFPNYDSGDVLNLIINQSTVVELLGGTDANGCPFSSVSGMATLFVQDGSDLNPPVAFCQDISVDIEITESAVITPADINNFSFDFETDFDQLILSIDQTTFDCSLVGTQQVTLTVTDMQGNSDQCTSNVTINDPNGYCCPIVRAIPNTPSTTKQYEADQIILSAATIKQGYGTTDITFKAGDYIQFSSGFEVELGAQFEAYIGPCGNSP